MWNIIYNLHTDAQFYIPAVFESCKNIVCGGGKNRCSGQWDIGVVWLHRKCNSWGIGRLGLRLGLGEGSHFWLGL